MLLFLSAVKLIAEIALLALFGQWVLGLLAGQRRGQNIFYQILQQVGRPFVLAARLVTPRKIVLERHLPLVAFLLLALVWVTVTALRIGHCFKIGVELCK
jgi:type III secretory pathway component EscU